MAGETPTATGTGSYGLYWLLLMDACTCLGVWPTSAATMPTMLGFCVASARESRISCCGVLDDEHRAVAVDDLAPRGRRC